MIRKWDLGGGGTRGVHLEARGENPYPEHRGAQGSQEEGLMQLGFPGILPALWGTAHPPPSTLTSPYQLFPPTHPRSIPHLSNRCCPKLGTFLPFQEVS